MPAIILSAREPGQLAAAHGDETDVALILARHNRHGLIKLARQIITDTTIVDDRMALHSDTELH